mgnify:FL=1
MKIFQIYEPLFKTQPILITNCSYSELAKYLKKKYGVEEKDDCITTAGQCLTYLDTKTESTLRIIYLKKLDKKPENLGVLIHELLHLVVRVLEDRGVPLIKDVRNMPGDETAAYLMEFYFLEVLKKI